LTWRHKSETMRSSIISQGSPGRGRRYLPLRWRQAEPLRGLQGHSWGLRQVPRGPPQEGGLACRQAEGGPQGPGRPRGLPGPARRRGDLQGEGRFRC